MAWSDLDLVTNQPGQRNDGADLLYAALILIGTIVAGAALLALALWGW